MKIIFESSRLFALPAIEEDINFIMDIESNSEYNRFIWQGTYEEHLEEIENQDIFLLIFIDKNTTDKIGYCLLERVSKFDVLELRRIAITKRGMGYGKEAVLAIFKFAFEDLNLNRIWLDVYPDNEVGINLYESVGMHKDGELRQSYKGEDGIYRNQIIYSILKSEWQK